MTQLSRNPSPTVRQQMVYLVRHAEATHNIKEREAVQAAKQKGMQDTDKARRAVLEDESLLDAPLSDDGFSQVLRASQRFNLLDKTKYPPPKVVLVSPLRRVLMTATELFLEANPGGEIPRFVAMEALREKRTGYAADEHVQVEVLEKEFPHVDFSDLKRPDRLVIPKGETNQQVRERGRAFLEGYLATNVPEDSVAIVTHKGWLRELRKTIKGWVDDHRIEVDFDLDGWYQTLFGNAEIRVADFGWTENKLSSIVSRSVENAAMVSSDSERSHQAEVERGLSQKEKESPNPLSLIQSMMLHFGAKFTGSRP